MHFLFAKCQNWIKFKQNRFEEKFVLNLVSNSKVQILQNCFELIDIFFPSIARKTISSSTPTRHKNSNSINIASYSISEQTTLRFRWSWLKKKAKIAEIVACKTNNCFPFTIFVDHRVELLLRSSGVSERERSKLEQFGVDYIPRNIAEECARGSETQPPLHETVEAARQNIIRELGERLVQLGAKRINRNQSITVI